MASPGSVDKSTDRSGTRGMRSDVPSRLSVTRTLVMAWVDCFPLKVASLWSQLSAAAIIRSSSGLSSLDMCGGITAVHDIQLYKFGILKICIG